MQPLDAERVREWRGRRMLSQQEVADRAGTSLFTIQRIERGEGNVRPRTGRGVAAALGIPIEELLPKVQAPLFRELPEQEPAEERREYAEHLLEAVQSEGLEAIIRDPVMADRLFALHGIVGKYFVERSLERGDAEHRWRLLDYRRCREALDRFCDYWEQALDEDRLDRRACDEFNTAAKLTSTLLLELWDAERVELRIQRGEDAQTIDKSEPWPPGLMEESELWPAIDRWMVIGLRVSKIAKERFGEDAAISAGVADLHEYARRKAG